MKSPLLNTHRDSIKKSAQKHGATSVRLFGSFARGEETAASDIDLLVEMEPNRLLFGKETPSSKLQFHSEDYDKFFFYNSKLQKNCLLHILLMEISSMGERECDN